MSSYNQPNKWGAELELDTQALSTMKIAEFDKTWADLVADKTNEEIIFLYKAFNYELDENNYHLMDPIPPEHVDPQKKDWVVGYKYNSDWFRSEHFRKDHDGLHVLFAGCSNTEGVGSKIDNVWTKIVYDELSKEYSLSGFFSLGKGGYGWQKILSAVFKYCKEYGKPDLLLINHPNILRNYYWIESEGQWRYTQQFPYSSERSDQDKIIKQNRDSRGSGDPFTELDLNPYPTLYEERQAFPIWATAWFAFVEFCKASDIKIVWTMWDDPEAVNVENSKLFEDTFFRISEANEEFIEKHRPDGKFKEGDMSARDGHPGYLTNLVWAEGFLKTIKDRGILDEVYKKSIKEA